MHISMKHLGESNFKIKVQKHKNNKVIKWF